MLENTNPIIDQYTPPIDPETLKLPENNKAQDMSFVVDSIRNTIPKPTTNLDIVDSNLQKESNLNAIFTPNNKASFYNEGFKLDEAYTRLNSGEYVAKFDNFLQGVDNEQRFALDQTKSNKWLNGLGKFLGKTGTAILGGTIGTLYGAAEAIFTADFDAVWDNDFQDVMDDWNVKMDYKLPNYYTQEEKEKGFFGSLGTANFWANDFLGGLSFTVGAIATEAIWAAGTGGTSLVTAASRYGLRGANTLRTAKNLKAATKPIKDYLSKVNGINRSKRLGQTAQGLNTLRYVYTSAGYEAGVEARHYANAERNRFYSQFEELNGREATPAEIAQFEENLKNTSNSVFATNLALVGSSNLIIFGKMFNIKSPLSLPKSKLSKTIFGSGVEVAEDGTKQAIKRNVAQRVAGTTYSVFKAPVVEGIYEEGLQAVTSTTASTFLESSYDLNRDTADLMESIYEGFSHTYGTKEGWKEVGLGMLIGMFGGGISSIGTGQNPFSNVIDAASKESRVDQQKAEVLNHYSSKKLAEELFRVNSLAKASEVGQRAAKNQDIFGQESARTMGMLSNIIYGERMGYGDLVRDEFMTEVDNFDAEQLAENMGITVLEAKELKGSITEDYNNTRDEYLKNRDFANYIIGNGKIDGENEINVEVARDMIAYQMTMASKSETIADDFVKAIMSEVGDFNTQAYKFKNVLEIEDTLRRATKESRNEFNNIKKEHKSVSKKLANLEKQRLTQERRLNSTREDNQDIAAKLNQTTTDIANLQEQLYDIEIQLEQSYSALTLYTAKPDSEGYILGKELANIEKNISEFEDYLKNVNQKDKTKSARIQKYLQEYQKSIEGSRLYGEIIEGLLNPETGLKGQTRTFLNKLKEHNNPTAKLVENLKKAQQNFAEGQAEIFTDRVDIPTSVVEEEEADIMQDVSGTTEVDGQTVSTPVTPTTSSIDDFIQELLSSNDYALQNFGQDIQSKKPTQEEIDRYEELLSKLNVDPDSLISQSINTISKRGLNKIGLTKSEVQEYKDLNQKLSDWRVIDGVGNGDVSITDLIEQKEALNSEVKDRDIVPMDTAEDLEIAVGAKNNLRSIEMSGEMINTPDTAMVQRKGNTIQLTHVKVKSIVDKGAVFKKNGNIITDYENLPKGVYSLDFENTSVAVKIVGHSRMEFSKEEFDKLLNTTNIVVVDTTNVKGSSWSPVYEQKEDGTFSPMLTDYDITLEGSDYNILDPQRLYDMNIGEDIFFKMSIKDTFNLSFEEKLINAISNYDANPSTENKNKLDSIKKEIYEKVSIYIVNTNNDVVGQLKASAEDVQQTDSFKAIRKYASEVLIEKYDPNNARFDFSEEGGDFVNSSTRTEFTLPFTTSVSGIFAGMPNLNLNINENNEAVPNKVDLNDNTINMIDSFGVVENGEITLNKNYKVNLKGVNTQFIKGINNTTPIVIINYRNQKIAYPISLKEESSNVLNKITEILDSKTTLAKKAINISKTLAENGIDPKQYDVKHIDVDNSFFNSPNLGRMLNDLERVTQSISREDVISKEFDKDQLRSIGQITINLENTPFQSPKIKVDLKTNLRYNKETETEEENHFNLTGKVEKSRLDFIANELVSKGEDSLSTFNKKVLSSYRKEVEELVTEKIKLSQNKKSQSVNEINKNC